MDDEEKKNKIDSMFIIDIKIKDAKEEYEQFLEFIEWKKGINQINPKRQIF